jgi:hypothetical protein
MLWSTVAASADRGLHLECKVVVPKEFMTQKFPPPNGQPESVRYKVRISPHAGHPFHVMPVRDFT